MARVSPLVILPLALFAGLAGLFAAGMWRDDPDVLPSTVEGAPAPALSLSPLGDMPPFQDPDLRMPGVKLVNFWASWCVPCRVEHPNLEKLSAEGLPILGINYKDKEEDALAFLGELGNPYAAVAADDTGRNAIEWGVYGVPETFVIDADGTVLLRYPGPLTQDVIDDTIRPVIDGATE